MKKVYTIVVSIDEKGKQTMRRINKGFSAIELLGTLELTKSEILEQIKGTIKPDVINRQIVK